MVGWQVDFSKIPKRRGVVHCETEEQAVIFYNAMEEHYPRKLSTWISDKWSDYAEDTCYNPRLYDDTAGMTFADIDYYMREGFTIVELNEIVEFISDLSIESSDVSIESLFGME